VLDALLAPVHAVAQLVAAGGSLVGWIFAARHHDVGDGLRALVVFPQAAAGTRPGQPRALARARRASILGRAPGEEGDDLAPFRRDERQHADAESAGAAVSAARLVGTVSGMLEVFDSMAILGSADARSMASGVSKAMNCTMTGLAVSISGMYPVYYFASRIRRQTESLGRRIPFLRHALAMRLRRHSEDEEEDSETGIDLRADAGFSS